MAHGNSILPPVLFAAALTLSLAPAAGAMPAFARRYAVSCQQCHHPIPRLTAFGDLFASHGFRMAPGEQPPDTLPTGDDLLMLPRMLPVALRVDAYAQLFVDEERADADFQTPWVMKILSSAPLSDHLSYYFYFLWNERGAVAGVEDAFVVWNDVAGRPLDVAVGQFQVSDPLFKRELRLSFEDYVIYRTGVGDQPADLTYDRGLMLMADAAGFTLTAELINGNGIGPAGSDKRLDDGGLKNVFAHLTRDLVPGVRLGALGYGGSQDPPEGPSTARRNTVWMTGADATLAYGPFEVNGQFVHREDDRPTFTPGERRSVVDGGFVEALWLPEGSRWYGVAVWNRVIGGRPILDFGLGGPADVDRHHSAALGAGYVLQRNVRMSGEAGYDFVSETGRMTLGMTLGY
jgi:hypothetical protein